MMVMDSFGSLKATFSHEVIHATEEDYVYKTNSEEYETFMTTKQFKMFTHDEVKEMVRKQWERTERYKSNEDYLISKVLDLETDVIQARERENEATVREEECRVKYEQSNELYQKAVKSLDAAHHREQNNQDMIASLMNQAATLRAEIEKKEIEEEELMIEMGGTGHREMKQAKQKADEEVKRLKHELAHMKTEVDSLVKEAESANESRRLDAVQMYEMKVKNGDLEREVGVLKRENASYDQLVNRLKKFLILLKTHYDALQLKLDKIHEEHSDNKNMVYIAKLENTKLLKELQLNERETNRVKGTISDLMKQNEVLREAQKDRDEQLKHLKMKQIKNNTYLKHEINGLKKTIEKKIQEGKSTTSELTQNAELRSLGAKQKEKAADRAKQHQITMLSTYLLKATYLAESVKAKLNNEIMNNKGLSQEIDFLKKNIIREVMKSQAMFAETNRMKIEFSKLQEKIEDGLLDIKNKESIITDLKKEIERKNFSWKKTVNLLDDSKKEKQLLAKAIEHVKDSNKELNAKTKVIFKLSEQLKESIFKKNHEILKGERALKKKNNEILKLDFRMAKTKATLINSKKQIAKLEKEDYAKRKQVVAVEEEKRFIIKELSRFYQENSMISSQLDRKCSSLAVVQNKLSTMEVVLKNGSWQYNQRLDDIRIMRLEILKLRRERNTLLKAFQNMSNLRSEVYHLYKDLLEEKLRNRALEDELKTPINYHRWRILEGTDPDKMDLIRKANVLEAKTFKLTKETIRKDEELRQANKIIEALKKNIAHHSGGEMVDLNRLNAELAKKQKEIITLSSEVATLGCENYELKRLFEVREKEQKELKKKYLDLKLKVYKKTIPKDVDTCPSKESIYANLAIDVTEMVVKQLSNK